MESNAPDIGIGRYAKLYLTTVVVVHLGLLVWGAIVHGPCWDEVGHLSAGLSHWRTGQFDQYRVNPPLVRVLATAPLVSEKLKITFDSEGFYSLGRPEFDKGSELMRTYGRDCMRLLRTARLACLPWSLLTMWVIWKWGTELFGRAGAILPVTLWAFSPLVLTNAHLLTPDVGTTAAGLLACYTFRHWLQTGTWRLAYLCGIALGLALLTKYSWLFLLGLWPAQWLLHRAIQWRRSASGPENRATSIQLVFMFAVSVFVINLGFGFEGSFTKLKEYSFYSNPLTGTQIDRFEEKRAGNRFHGTWLGQIPVPLPRNMVQGIDRQKVDFEQHMLSYLRGEWRDRGWWYYYLYAVLVKVPVPFQLLMASGFLFCCAGRIKKTECIDLLFPGVALFVFVSSQTGFNHHVRYVLPAFPFLMIGAGALWSERERTIAWLQASTTALLVCGVSASLLMSPFWHSYFNVLVGGPKNGPLHLLDSNVDWGQDLLLLEDWVQMHPEFPLDGVQHSLPVSLGVQSLVDVTKVSVPTGLNEQLRERLPGNEGGPRPGRYAVSVLSIYRTETGYEYFQSLEPVDTVGYTIRIYDISPSQANEIRKSLGYPALSE